MTSMSQKSTKPLLLLTLIISLSAVLYVTYLYVQVRSLLQSNDEFHTKLYDSGLFNQTTWLGVPMQQLPFDSQEMQKLIFEIKPDVIIETGTFCGGSALYYAGLIDQFKPTCKIVTVDIDPHTEGISKYRVWNDHVIALKGSSIDPKIIEQIKKLIPPKAVVLVTLDSDHHRDHVYQELKLYSQFVTPGSYLVVQDTNVNGHPVQKAYGPGPMEALNDFLKENNDFKSDPSREEYFISFYPKGWLKRLQ